MNRNDFELTYRRSAATGASPFGLVVAMYDTLSGDLRRAAAAIRANEIEKRSTALNHAALVLAHLENWIDQNSGEELAGNLVTFYAYIRSQMLLASTQQSAAVLDEAIVLILQVRSAWQQRDSAATATPSISTGFAGNNFAFGGSTERVVFSQTA